MTINSNIKYQKSSRIAPNFVPAREYLFYSDSHSKILQTPKCI